MSVVRPRRRTARLALIALLGSLLAVPAFVAAQAEAVEPDPFHGTWADGMSPTRADAATAMDRQASAGIGTMRQYVFWDRIETQPGRYDWTVTDRLVEDASARGMTVLPTLLYTPSFYVAKPTAKGLQPPDDPAVMGAFAKAMVERYGPFGEFWRCTSRLLESSCRQPYAPVTAWEVWNEPDHPGWWKGKPDVNEYFPLLRTVSTSIRQADPGAEVVLGAMLSTEGSRQGGYLDRLYGLGGGAFFDTLSLNPYAHDVGGMLTFLAGQRAIAAKHGDAEKPMRVTEYGWATGGRSASYVVSEGCQAALLHAATAKLREVREKYRIKSVIQFQWRDAQTTSDLWPHYAGLLRVDGTAKPAVAAIAAAIAEEPAPAGLTLQQACPANRRTMDGTRVTTTGSGTVVSTPAGISCGTDCAEDFPYNTVVTLKATPAPGERFVGWAGEACGTGTSPTCSYTSLNAGRTATAMFTSAQGTSCPTPGTTSTASPTQTASTTPSATRTPSDEPTPSDEATPSEQATPSDEPTPADGPAGVLDAVLEELPPLSARSSAQLPTDTATPSDEPTPTDDPTPTGQATPSDDPTPTDDPTPGQTGTPTTTPTATPTPTGTPPACGTTAAPTAGATTPPATATSTPSSGTGGGSGSGDGTGSGDGSGSNGGTGGTGGNGTGGGGTDGGATSSPSTGPTATATTGPGSPESSAPAQSTTPRELPAGGYLALASPVRVLDSRTGLGTSRGAKRGTVVLDLSSRLPADATAAVLNVTVTGPSGTGYLVAYPQGSPRPGTSNVNFVRAQTQANEVVVQLPASKRVVLLVDSATAHVVADLVGSFTRRADAPGLGRLVVQAPQRVLDSRSGLGTTKGRKRGEVVLDLSRALPAGATSAVLNVTLTGADARGYLVAYPTGTTRPGTSNVNVERGQTQANEVFTRVGTGANAGRVSLFVDSTSAGLVVDLVAAVVPSGGQLVTALAEPQRVLDTREGLGTSRGRKGGPVVLTLPAGAVPADATGVVLNVTTTGSSRPGFVTVHPAGSRDPGTSNVNFRSGVNQANEVLSGLDGSRQVTLRVGGSGGPQTHLVVDVVGYLTAG